MNRIYVGISRVEILAAARELSPLQNIQTTSSTHSPSNSSYFCGSKVARAYSLTNHMSRAKFKNQWSYTSTQFALFHGIVGLYLKHILMYISRKTSHSIWSYKGTFLSITYLSHAHYMTHLFLLHWSNYINPLTQKLNPSEQCSLLELFTGDSKS
jgi:hypothetical protein